MDGITTCEELEAKIHAITTIPARTRSQIVFDVRMYVEGFHKTWDEGCESEQKFLTEMLTRCQFELARGRA